LAVAWCSGPCAAAAAAGGGAVEKWGGELLVLAGRLADWLVLLRWELRVQCTAGSKLRGFEKFGVDVSM
jgi:hypothetical protein